MVKHRKRHDEIYTLFNHITQGNHDWHSDTFPGMVNRPAGMNKVDSITTLAAQMTTFHNQVIG